jgi:hypothetical protein
MFEETLAPPREPLPNAPDVVDVSAGNPYSGTPFDWNSLRQTDDFGNQKSTMWIKR